jgi:hypothetical protein
MTYEQALDALTVENGGRLWTIGVNSGRWYIHDGRAWVQAAFLKALATSRQFFASWYVYFFGCSTCNPGLRPAAQMVGCTPYLSPNLRSLTRSRILTS